jgi:hypothetical protein
LKATRRERKKYKERQTDRQRESRWGGRERDTEKTKESKREQERARESRREQEKVRETERT